MNKGHIYQTHIPVSSEKVIDDKKIKLNLIL